MTGNDQRYSEFISEISSRIPQDRIYTDDLRCLAWGTDAGFYRLLPKVVVRAANEDELRMIMRSASSRSLPVTFRAAGTSLSGQAITDSILVVAGK
ncbi:MAG: FAD-binding protein, partial [Muribaculaceae bacterium]|nr:FAD-binding protein [Muribaculaceae bacterium]